MNRLACTLSLGPAPSSCCRSQSPWDWGMQGDLFISSVVSVGDMNKQDSWLPLLFPLYGMKFWTSTCLSRKWGSNKTIRSVEKMKPHLSSCSCVNRGSPMVRWAPESGAETTRVTTQSYHLLAVWLWRRHSPSMSQDTYLLGALQGLINIHKEL